MLIIELNFPAGRFHATPWGRHVNEGVPEWPPSPYRMIRALYDVWKRKRPDWEEARIHKVLGELASSEPKFRLPDVNASHTRSFLSKNTMDQSDKTLIFDGFVVIPKRASVLMGWPELKLDPESLEDLEELLSLMNYLGRSESWVEARPLAGISGIEWNCIPVMADRPRGETEVIQLACVLSPERYVPVPAVSRKKGKFEMLSWMDAIAYSTADLLQSKLSDPPALRYVDYIRQADCFQAGIAPRLSRRRPDTRAVLYALETKVPPRVIETLEIAERVRAKLMGKHRRIAGGPEKVSSKFSGKNRSGEPLKEHEHVFILPLDCNRDGRIDHLLVKCRDAFEDEERRALGELESLWQSDGRPDIRCIPVQWSTAEDPIPFEIAAATKLVSATPFVAPRHHRKGRGTLSEWLEHELVWDCKNHGLPEPVRITRMDHLEVQGRSVRWLEFRRNRKDDAVRPAFGGFEVEFAEPVPRIIALGYGCHFGLGQFRAVG